MRERIGAGEGVVDIQLRERAIAIEGRAGACGVGENYRDRRSGGGPRDAVADVAAGGELLRAAIVTEQAAELVGAVVDEDILGAADGDGCPVVGVRRVGDSQIELDLEWQVEPVCLVGEVVVQTCVEIEVRAAEPGGHEHLSAVAVLDFVFHIVAGDGVAHRSEQPLLVGGERVVECTRFAAFGIEIIGQHHIAGQWHGDGGELGGIEGAGEKLHVIERALEHRHQRALGAGEVVVLAAGGGVGREQLVGGDRDRSAGDDRAVDE